ncbi:MAG: MurR/RpiR family transcriptional regulator [Pseudomonadota bacterium]
MAGLRDLLISVRRGESDLKLGNKASDALGQILEIGQDRSLLTITALAERLKVNPSTLTRLARSLGYSGFSAFQDVLLSDTFAKGTDFYSRQARTALSGDMADLDVGIRQLADENRRNIVRFAETVDIATFASAVDALANRPRIRLYAIRQFLSLIAFMSYGLGMIRSDVALLDSPGLGTAEGLAAMNKGDVLIVASCAPYTQNVVDVCGAASQSGMFCIAITDRASSPLVEHADCSLFVPHDSSFLSNSITAFSFCAECLINATATALGDSAATALERREAMIDRLRIER